MIPLNIARSQCCAKLEREYFSFQNRKCCHSYRIPQHRATRQGYHTVPYHPRLGYSLNKIKTRRSILRTHMNVATHDSGNIRSSQVLESLTHLVIEKRELHHIASDVSFSLIFSFFLALSKQRHTLQKLILKVICAQQCCMK